MLIVVDNDFKSDKKTTKFFTKSTSVNIIFMNNREFVYVSVCFPYFKRAS